MPNIDLNAITIGERLRAIDERRIKELSSRSIEEVGLLHPPVVHRTEVGYALISGAHRLEAYRRLGRTEIEVRIVDSTSSAGPSRNATRTFAAQPSLAKRAELTYRRKEVPGAAPRDPVG